ncbi:DUF2232 domain-containing protein [Paenibacillus sp. MBLB4367]|uniref:DUF2232 domain-containing protein n=1 Tax=Paenibacillus sp. MBLB4367 TaxID=3384767 RepID=UPI003907F5AB
MNRDSKGLIPTIVWCMIYVLLMLSFFTPLNGITSSFLMVPPLVLYMWLDGKKFTFAYVVVLLLLYILTGKTGLFLIMVSLFFLVAVIVMGQLYKKKWAARGVIMAGALTLLGEMVLILLIASLFGANPIGAYKDMLGDTMTSMSDLLNGIVPKDMQDLLVRMMVQMIPLFMITTSAYFAFVTHAITRWRLKSMGLYLPGLPPLREWRVPRSIVLYYAITIVLDFFMDIQSDSILVMIVLNLYPLLTFAFVIQSLSFLSFVAYQKGWGKWLPIVAVVVMVVLYPVLPVFVTLFSLLGLLDAIFPLRSRFTNKS